MKVLAVCNQKGGVGKTTTTLNLANALQTFGQRVLVVDADPQGNLTRSLVPEQAERKQSLSELIHYNVADIPYTPDMFITHAGALDIIVSSKILAAANSLLATISDSNAVLKTALAILTHDGADYDVVLFDCAPALDLLVINALTASTGAIIPTEPADYSIDGIVSVFETITRVQKQTNPDLKIQQIVINKFDARKKNHKALAHDIIEAFDGLVFPTPIPLVKEVETSADDVTAMQHDKQSRAWPLYLGLAGVILHE